MKIYVTCYNIDKKFSQKNTMNIKIHVYLFPYGFS